MVFVFLADGFEEIEALTPVDVLRRAGLEVLTVGVGGKEISGSHGIVVKCDVTEKDVERDLPDGVILPGGMPGTRNLGNSEIVKNIVNKVMNSGGLVAAICAAPSVLGCLGLLEGKTATCYPGFEDELKGASIGTESVCVDGNIITAKGPGVSLDFAFSVLEYLSGNKSVSYEIGDSMQCVR